MSDMWQDQLAKILLYQAVGTPCRLVVQHVHTLALDNTEGLRFNNTDPSGTAAAAHASQLSFADVASLVKRSETSNKLNIWPQMHTCIYSSIGICPDYSNQGLFISFLTLLCCSAMAP